ncbi:hypothetical protein VDGL01_02175 [Verticillium dahliae]
MAPTIPTSRIHNGATLGHRSSRLFSLRLFSLRLFSPRLSSPRLSSPRLFSPRLALLLVWQHLASCTHLSLFHLPSPGPPPPPSPPLRNDTLWRRRPGEKKKGSIASASRSAISTSPQGRRPNFCSTMTDDPDAMSRLCLQRKCGAGRFVDLASLPATTLILGHPFDATPALITRAP